MNEKAERIIRGVAVFLLLAALVAGIIGTAIMFNDKAPASSYYGAYYNYYRVTRAGYMPLVGTICLLVGAILFLISAKKPQTAIGTIVFFSLATVLLYASCALLTYKHTAWSGYYLCVFAACDASGVIGCCIALLVLSAVRVKKKEASKGNRTSVNYHNYTAELLEAKSLLDAGVFTEAEFAREKARIATSYGLDPYRSSETKDPRVSDEEPTAEKAAPTTPRKGAVQTVLGIVTPILIALVTVFVLVAIALVIKNNNDYFSSYSGKGDILAYIGEQLPGSYKAAMVLLPTALTVALGLSLVAKNNSPLRFGVFAALILSAAFLWFFPCYNGVIRELMYMLVPCAVVLAAWHAFEALPPDSRLGAFVAKKGWLLLLICTSVACVFFLANMIIYICSRYGLISDHNLLGLYFNPYYIYRLLFVEPYYGYGLVSRIFGLYLPLVLLLGAVVTSALSKKVRRLYVVTPVVCAVNVVIMAFVPYSCFLLGFIAWLSMMPAAALALAEFRSSLKTGSSVVETLNDSIK